MWFWAADRLQSSLEMLDVGCKGQWKVPGKVSSATFTPDGRHIVTRNENGTIYVLRLAESSRP